MFTARYGLKLIITKSRKATISFVMSCLFVHVCLSVRTDLGFHLTDFDDI